MKTILYLLTTALLLIPQSVLAADQIFAPGRDGKPFFEFTIYQQGEVDPWGNTSTWNMSPEMQQAVADGAGYWARMLSPGAANFWALPMAVYSINENNAAAGSAVSGPYTQLGKEIITGIVEYDWLGQLVIGDTVGLTSYTLSPARVLPANEGLENLQSIVIHELGHALGIAANVDNASHVFQSVLTQYSSHLYDQRGVQARPGQTIRWDENLAQPDDFLVSPDVSHTNGEMLGGTLYFKGNNADEVLNGAILTGNISGVPINGWEYGYEPDGTVVNFLEASHIELRNSLMSHQGYRNYGVFIEAELAIMQDIGFTIDRRDYFGFSEYRDGQTYDNTNGYFARSNGQYLPGLANTNPLGIGFHLYGSNNAITQKADLLACGWGGVGVRIDGSGNAFTVASGTRIAADGAEGTGLMVAYGKGNVLNSRGKVSALGSGGVSARFDFGSNMVSNGEQRGSYIHRYFDPSDSTWKDHTSPDSELHGALVKQFNVSGGLAGSAAAIYISDNALVKEINILSGASLSGDIISNWNPLTARLNPNFSPPQNNDLITRLSFGRAMNPDGTPATSGGDASFHMIYDGEIGTSNHSVASIDMKLHAGTLAFFGTARVIGVENMAGATLSGNGTYTIDALAGVGGSGNFISKGALAPGASPFQLGNMQVNFLDTHGVFTHEGLLSLRFDPAGATDQLEINGGNASGGYIKGTLGLSPLRGFYRSGQVISIDASAIVTGSDAPAVSAYTESDIVTSLASPTLGSMNMVMSGKRIDISPYRAPNAYSQYAASGHAARAGLALRGIADVAEGDMQNLLTALDFSAPDGSAVRAALPQLTAAPYALAAQASAEANLGIGRMALEQLRSASGTVAGANADEQHIATTTSKTGGLASGDAASQWSAFVMPFGGGSLQQPYAGAPGYNSSQAGLMGGVFRQNSSLSTSLYTAFSRRQVDMWSSAGAQARSTTLHVGAAALWSEDSAGSGWQAWAHAQVGVENTDMRRSVAFENYARQNSSAYTSFNGVAQLGGGYMWRAGELSFGPKAGLEYALNALPAMEEDDGGGSRLGMDAYTRHDLRGIAGLMATWNKDLGEGRALRVNAEAVWRQDLLPEQREIRTHFADYGQHSFDTRVEREGQGSLGLMGGVTIRLRQDISLNAQVEADVLRPGYSNVGGGLSLRWEF